MFFFFVLSQVHRKLVSFSTYTRKTLRTSFDRTRSQSTVFIARIIYVNRYGRFKSGRTFLAGRGWRGDFIGEGIRKKKKIKKKNHIYSDRFSCMTSNEAINELSDPITTTRQRHDRPRRYVATDLIILRVRRSHSMSI